MKALTLRHLKPDLAKAIERRAEEGKTSLSQAVIAILEQATGLGPKRRRRHHDLDFLAGTWSEAEAKAFAKDLSRQRRVDSELWR